VTPFFIILCDIAVLTKSLRIQLVMTAIPWIFVPTVSMIAIIAEVLRVMLFFRVPAKIGFADFLAFHAFLDGFLFREGFNFFFWNTLTDIIDLNDVILDLGWDVTNFLIVDTDVLWVSTHYWVVQGGWDNHLINRCERDIAPSGLELFQAFNESENVQVRGWILVGKVNVKLVQIVKMLRKELKSVLERGGF